MSFNGRYPPTGPRSFGANNCRGGSSRGTGWRGGANRGGQEGGRGGRAESGTAHQRAGRAGSSFVHNSGHGHDRLGGVPQSGEV